jgi:propionyl-CoA carboxylase alpha chain
MLLDLPVRVPDALLGAANGERHGKCDQGLVANRGEIAVRIMRTLRKLGIPSVAVHHAIDASLPWRSRRSESNCSVRRRSRPTSTSPQSSKREAHRRRCSASGIGFLSGTLRRCRRSRHHVHRPVAERNARDGDKIESKRLAQKVSTIPGFTSESSADHAVKIAREIGYPILIKASAAAAAGCASLDDAECATVSAPPAKPRRFGDGRVFIERFVERRRIEIQVLGDAHGNVVYLGDASVDPAPAPEGYRRGAFTVLDEDASCRPARAGARASSRLPVGRHGRIHRRSARNFFFLEMNTRLQVEHPVTELITGLDIVAEQIRIAWRAARRPERHPADRTRDRMPYAETPTPVSSSDEPAPAAAAARRGHPRRQRSARRPGRQRRV